MQPFTGDFSGIVSTVDQTTATYLPLEELSVHAFIADVSARVLLSQVYSHSGCDILPEAYYVFPIPARAAVCSFEMQTDNGIRLKGVVKELSQAKEEYQEALSEGRLTGLLEQFRQDVFVVSIGAIPPRTLVTARLSYVVDLSEDDQINTVRFQLSSHVGARYGAPLNSALYHGTAHRARLSITVDIEMPGSIINIASLNHPLRDVQGASPRSSDAVTMDHFACKGFSSADASLHKDFLLVVQALNLDKPRCFAERLACREGSLNSQGEPTTAIALTIVPRFDLPILPAQEYLFLVDRSGSMSGGRISMAKQVLIHILKGLPSANTAFNVFSFGSYSESLWPQSMQYNNNTGAVAVCHVDSMDADFGGTELFDALVHVFNSRSKFVPTCVIVLTDGDVYNINDIISSVRQAVSLAPAIAPLRLFTLGVGDGASTALCQAIAAEGRGAHLMTVEGEDIALKAIRLVKTMRTPKVEELSIDWGKSCREVRQAPCRIPAISPGMRLLVTAIITGERIPNQPVTLSLRLEGGKMHNYEVPVRPILHHIPSKFTDGLTSSPAPPLIHTLAAHLLIQDIESMQARELQNWSGLSPATKRRNAKQLIVKLGTRYQVTSSHTAFVAVASPQMSADPDVKNGNGRRERVPGSTRGSAENGIPNGTPNGTPSQGGSNRKLENLVLRNGHKDVEEQSSHRGVGNRPPSECSTAHSIGSPKTSPHLSRQNHALDPTPARLSSSPSRANVEESHLSIGQGVPESNSQSEDNHSEASQRADVPSTQAKLVKVASQVSPVFEERSGTSEAISSLFAQKPPPELVEDIVYIPNPLGGDHPPIICAAPPLQQDTVIATSWLKSLWSRLFHRGVGNDPSSSKKKIWGFPVMRDSEVSSKVAAIGRLQSFEDGSVSQISQLPSVTGIPEFRLRDTLGSTSEAIWATAVIVAFLRKTFPSYRELWEDLEIKAVSFGSGICGSHEAFEVLVQKALELFWASKGSVYKQE